MDQKGGSKFARTFKMDKEFYNINFLLREISKPDLGGLFRYDKPFNDFEQGCLLSQIIE